MSRALCVFVFMMLALGRVQAEPLASMVIDVESQPILVAHDNYKGIGSHFKKDMDTGHGAAIEATPGWLWVAPSIDLEEYQASPWWRILWNTSLSFGVKKKADGATQVSQALEIPLWDNKDPRIGGLYAAVSACAKRHNAERLAGKPVGKISCEDLAKEHARNQGAGTFGLAVWEKSEAGTKGTEYAGSMMLSSFSWGLGGNSSERLRYLKHPWGSVVVNAAVYHKAKKKGVNLFLGTGIHSRKNGYAWGVEAHWLPYLSIQPDEEFDKAISANGLVGLSQADALSRYHTGAWVEVKISKGAWLAFRTGYRWGPYADADDASKNYYAQVGIKTKLDAGWDD